MNWNASFAEEIMVTVITPVFNGEAFLSAALDSVLGQKGVGQIEFLVLNDGSSDASAEILDRYKDSRLTVIHQSNMGLAATLNKGIALARGRYIARLDQDDLMMPGRLAAQIRFLEGYPEIAMVGTSAEIRVADTPDGRLHCHPSDPDVLRVRLLFDNPFVHSSMMIRADVAREIGGYSEDKARQPPEDYELWSRISRSHKVSNIPEVLTVYREMSSSMSRISVNPFLNKVLLISAENLYAVLSSRWTFDDCLSLAHIYHAAAGAPRKLKKSEALSMVGQALEIMFGPQASWPRLICVEARRINSHITSRFWQATIPAALLRPARWIYRRLFLNLMK